MFALSFIGGAIGDLSVFESTEVCFVSRLNCHCCTVAICSLPGLCLKCSSYARDLLHGPLQLLPGHPLAIYSMPDSIIPAQGQRSRICRIKGGPLFFLLM